MILLTGAAGFIGGKTAQILLDRGETVLGIDNLNDYYDTRLKEYRLKTLRTNKGFTFVEADIENKVDLEEVFRHGGISTVINLAARAGVRYSLQNPGIYLTTNALGTLNILELMKKYQVKKMILASTSSLYAGQRMPYKEDLAVNTPISPYAASKKPLK